MALRSTIFLASLVAITTGTAAGAMTKNVEAVRPRIAQRGTTVEVSIQGVSLANPREIVFFKPGIRATEVQTAPEAPPTRGFAHGGRISEEIRCKFEIAPDCPPGEHAFRVLTATELTCIGTFHVSPFPVIDEEEPNNAYSNDTLESALPVTLNVTVRGQLGNGAREDLDLYRVAGKAGQHLSVELESARIADRHYGDSEFDLALRILDDKGRPIATNDDNSLHLQDPVSSIVLPADGTYYVEVRRSIFTPSDTIYCVHIGDYRRPLAIFPPGGQLGTTQAVTCLGDPQGAYERLLHLPAIEGTFDDFGDDESALAPTPMKLRASPYPNLLEDPTNPETRVPAIPMAVNGIIDSSRDVDLYRLTVRKGEKLRVHAFAASLGSPIDAAIRIIPIDADGQRGTPEVDLDDSPVTDHDIFGTSFRGGGGLPEAIDPSAIWEPKQDGEYLLEVRDTSGAGCDTGVYRVEIAPLSTVVQTLLSSATFDWTESMRVTGLAVPRGDRWTVDLSFPSGQFNTIPCEFDLIAHGLPQGVRLISPRIKPGTSRWPIQLVADADAAFAGAVFTLEAKPVDSNVQVETRSQQNVPFINHSGGSAWRTVRTDRYIMGVTDPAPFSVHIDQPQAVLVRGGELAVPVKITRHNGFTGDIELRCGSVPRSITMPPPSILSADQSEGLLQLGAEANASLGTLPLFVIGSTVRDDIDDFLGAGHIRVSSEIVTLTVAEPYVELAAQPDSIRRGERKTFTWSVRHHTPFEGAATVTLLGLPKGVTALDPPPFVTRDSTEVVFELQATDEALLGQASGLSCELTVPSSEGAIRQRTGRASLRIDPALK